MIRRRLARWLVRVGAGPLAFPRDAPIREQRRRSELVRFILVPARGLRWQRTTIGSVAGEWLRPRGTAGSGALLYLHGGGYCVLSAATHRGLAARIAAAIGVPAFVPDYRLAPEYPYPAALDDAIDAYRGLLARGIPHQRIAIAGDSAGGGLALALAMAVRDRGLPAPAVVGLICPWLDLERDISRMRPSAPREPILRPQLLARWAEAYVGEHDPAEPGISPINGDLTALPPVVLHYASDDLLVDDGERLGAALDSAEAHRFEGLWHDFHTLAGALPGAGAAVREFGESLRARLAPTKVAPRVAIVGAGMSGLCIGAKLRAAGIDDFTIHEKAAEVGGTWRENRYPGLSCDVPARFYSYSFSPNGGWSSTFAPGPEIQRYFRRFADDHGLREHIRFGSEVASARRERGRWRLTTSDGHEDVADVLVTATGVLHHPRVPEIAGLESFSGRAFHSARWPDDLSPEALRDMRVAVIGTGSTGVQITTALGGQVERLELFQRTPQWILPVPNHAYSSVARTAFERLPALSRLVYRAYDQLFERTFGTAVVSDGWQRRAIATLCRLHLRWGIRDAGLRSRLTPDYEPMCKRLVMSAGFYPALQTPGVELVTEAIDHVEPGGIVTADGRLHSADAIVLATGFDFHAYMRPMEIVSDDGATLKQAWIDGPRAYRTVTMPGFPNFFMLMGPHSPVGNQSLIAVAEAQAEYALRFIELLRAGGLESVSPTADATDRFNEELRAAMPGTVWTTGCVSWYLGADGRPELWPWSPARHREILREPELEDYELVGVEAS